MDDSSRTHDHDQDPEHAQPSAKHWAGVNYSPVPIDHPSMINHESNKAPSNEPQTNPPDRDVFGNTPKNHKDWSHRRGEPRMFTLCWMMFLMGSTVFMFSSMSPAYSISANITRPAAQRMLLGVFIGFSILWPMIRFSQSSIGSKHVRFFVRDALVLYIPMQAVIWPQTFVILAAWEIEVVGAISALSLAWLLLLAGVISLGTSSIVANKGSSFIRILWMIVVLALVLMIPVFIGFTSIDSETGIDQPRISWMLSPISSIFELTRDRSGLGLGTKIYFEHWKMIIAVFCTGIAMLMFALANEVARSKKRA